jgi:uncharacterized membrane protein YoaK (UPF0700 family)
VPIRLELPPQLNEDSSRGNAGRARLGRSALVSIGRDVATSLKSNPTEGLLPLLFLALTFVTGVVDATTYLSLGHVFVANMTGNVVFLGFGIAGAGGISVRASHA